jgi:DNA-binding GntR family transcriptional regulator
MLPATTRFDPVDPRLPIAPQIHAILRRAILQVTLRPSETLSEKELSLRLGVSRTPVREALIKLADEGLVDIFPQRGTVVAPIRLAEVAEAQFMREALETAVVRRAAVEIDDRTLMRLEDCIAAQRRAAADHAFDIFMQLDEAFHALIADSLGMPRVVRQIQSVKGQLDRVRYLALPDPERQSAMCDQHAAIAAALAERDPDRAADRMGAHMREVFRSVDRLIGEQPDLFA